MVEIMDNTKFVGIDLDDTLYDRDSVYKNTYYVMEKEVISTETRFSKFNKVFQKYSIIEFDKYTAGKKNKLSYKVDRVKATYAEFGIQISEEEALIFHSLYEYFRNNITLRSHICEFIQLLYRHNLQPFILINGPAEDQRKKIKSLGLDTLIEENRIFVSGEIGFAKPDQRIFEYIEEELDTDGESILYIGDHIENDVMASMRKNWNPVYFDFNKQGTDLSNILTVTNFKSMINLLQEQILI